MLRKAQARIASVFCLVLLAACGGGGGMYTTTDGGGGGKPVTLSGAVSYESVPAVYSEANSTGGLDFSRVAVKPVRNAVVEVVEGATVLATTTTDESGNYQVTYTPLGRSQPTLVVLAETVAPAIEVQDNTDNNAVWGVVSAIDGTSTTKNLRARSGWTGWGYDNNNRSAAPFAVLDAMYTAAKAFTAERNVSFPFLQVRWSPQNVPQSGDKSVGFIGTSHFAPDENAIYILGKDGVDTDEFDNHVLAHEWAHFFQLNLSRLDSPGGQHTLGENLDPTLSFSEGSATAIAAIVLNDPLYVDTSWSAGGMAAFAQNAESAPASTDDPAPGILSELSNVRVLYDLYDAGSGETHDQLNLGLGTIYDIFVGPLRTTDALVTLATFVSELKRQQGVNSAAVDTVLAHFSIGAITTPWGDGDPTLREMYTDVSDIPSTYPLSLVGGHDYNEWEQNHYYVLTGNGGTITISANSSRDVGIAVYQAGALVGNADAYLSGTESVRIVTEINRKYVVVLTGFATTSGSYAVTASFAAS